MTDSYLGVGGGGVQAEKMVLLEARLWGAGIDIQFPSIPVRPASASSAL